MDRVKYKLKIRGLKTPSGTISIRALKEVLDDLVECSERGLRLAVQGESVKRGKTPTWLTKSLDFTVTGLKKGSTVLEVEAPSLGETATEQIRDQDLWYSKPTPKDTAFTLLSKSVADMTAENIESNSYDTGLLEGLLLFQPFLKSSAERIEFTSKDRPHEGFDLGMAEMEKICQLKAKTPEPMAFVISGGFDLIQHSNRRFHLRLPDGQTIPGTIDPEFLNLENMREWWGKKVTIKGMVHFHPNRKVRLIEAQVIKPAEAGEEVFERAPTPPTTMELFDIAPKKTGPKSPLMEVWGKWPGDESIDEILSALKE